MSIERIESLPEVITEEMREAVNNALNEMKNSMIRVDSEKDHQKDISARMKEEWDIPKREFNKLAKIMYNASLAEEARKNEEFISFAEGILSTDNTLEHK